MKPRRLLFLALLCTPVGLFIWLWRVPEFVSVPQPAKSYQKAMEKFATVEKAESALSLCPEGRSRLLTHGHKTERVFVLLHGLTNCPEQFLPLARILYASGANVVLPRARYAGFADRMKPCRDCNLDKTCLTTRPLGSMSHPGSEIESLSLGSRAAVSLLLGWPKIGMTWRPSYSYLRSSVFTVNPWS